MCYHNNLNLSKRGKQLLNILVTQLLGKLDFGGTYQTQDKNTLLMLEEQHPSGLITGNFNQ